MQFLLLWPTILCSILKKGFGTGHQQGSVKEDDNGQRPSTKWGNPRKSCSKYQFDNWMKNIYIISLRIQFNTDRVNKTLKVVVSFLYWFAGKGWTVKTQKFSHSYISKEVIQPAGKRYQNLTLADIKFERCSHAFSPLIFRSVFFFWSFVNF